mmetsp:Transcript_41479/g.93572  ORF Transcript_41479/g.93572 Transcript_41479/m.93572 type:complete len:208 (+) Transcript_41479:735-1358(+)
MWSVIVATILSASSISPANSDMRASALLNLVSSSSILLALSVIETSVLLSSRSHQCLWLSSSFCSSIRRKIIFWIMLITWSKCPARATEISWARRSSDREWVADADARISCMAFTFGSVEVSISIACTGDGGGTGLPGASVRTPPAFARMSMAAFIASISRLRVTDLSFHSVFFTEQAFSVCFRVAESSFKSSWADPRELSISPRAA